MNQTECIAAEALVLDTKFNILRILLIILSMIIIVLLSRVIWSYKTKSMKLHTNLVVS